MFFKNDKKAELETKPEKKKATFKVATPDIGELEKRLFEQLRKAKLFRETQLEPEWANNYLTVFASDARSAEGQGNEATRGPISIYEGLSAQMQQMPDSSVSIRYAFKYLRYLHSQASANPPSVTFTPRTQDIQDRRAANAASAFKEYARKTLKVQDVQDWRSLEALTYGTGISKLEQNPYAGDGVYNEEDETVTMKGAIEAKPVSVWNFWRDPDARRFSEVKWGFEAQEYDIEEACSRWPDYAPLLEKRKGKFLDRGMGSAAASEEWRKNIVQIFEYNEKGLPWNGMAGRHCFCIVEENKLVILDKMCVSPHPEACLPYQFHTDIDVPGRCEGKSFLDYISRLQELVDRIDTHILMNIQAHGSIKLVVWDDSGVTKDDITEDTYEIITVKGQGNTPPMYIQPPQIMPDINTFRDRIMQGMEALAGMNEQMFGQVKRELSGYAVQNSINSANLTRHRFFAKYRMVTEDFYDRYIQLAKKHMTDEEKINVTGQEDAYDLKFFTTKDLNGKFDYSTDYGTSFSLDPESRQEQIMQQKDLWKEAGVSAKQIVRAIGISDMKGVIDIPERAKKRQQEIFDKIEALYTKGLKDAAKTIMPKKNEAHAFFLEACDEFRTSALFQTFDEELQEIMDGHIDARIAMAAQQAAGAQGAQMAQAGGMSGVPGAEAAGPMAAPQAPMAIPAGVPPPV